MTESKRIRLRHKKLSDAREDYEWQTDLELCRLDAAEPITMTYKDYIAEFTFELCYPTSNRHEYAVETLAGEHIGNCVYYNVNQAESKAEMGIMIGNRGYWKQGYGSETINLLLDHIFSRTRLENIYLTTLDWNLRAHKCFSKCGFLACGELFRDGHKFILMVLHRHEWEKLHRQSAGAPQINQVQPTVS